MSNQFLQSARGQRFCAGLQLLSSGIAPKQAIPSLSPTLCLYNGDSSQSYVVRYIHKWLASGTAAAGSTLLVALSPNALSPVPTQNATNFKIQKLGPSSTSETSSALLASGVTLPNSPQAPVWISICSDFQLAAANLGQGDAVTNLNGMIVIPPGYGMGIDIISGSGSSPLYGVTVVWDEVNLN